MSIKKIAIVGPESTGKSQLTEHLALHYNTAWVKEYAREYLEKLKRDYTYDDLSIIAKKQIETEDERLSLSNKFLFIDTNLLVIKVWSDFIYCKTEPWIIEEIKKRKYDLHLLCDVDLPWQPDPLREHPHMREKLFAIYKSELENFGIEYKVVRGEGDERLQNAKEWIEQLAKFYR